MDAAVALAFGCVLIGAGHGVGPIGLVMLAGSPEAWGFPTTVGWVGIALLAISVSFPRRGLYLSLALVGLSSCGQPLSRNSSTLFISLFINVLAWSVNSN